MYAWGSVGLVVVLVVTLVVIAATRSGPAAPTGSPTAYTPAAASVVREVTNVPASVYNQVGITSPATPITPPRVLTNQPLQTVDGKPGMLYVGGEFCPFCAADRWALTTSLSRFGTFHGLGAISSIAETQLPATPTFTYYHTTYTSPYLGANLVEQVSEAFNQATGNYFPLEPLTKAETAIATKYSSSQFLGAGASQAGGLSIPFVDIGNKVLASGAPFYPTILSGATRAQIAAGLSNPTNPITQAIIASSNYYSAAICATDGDQPASVCTSHGVTVAASAMHLKL